jgi:hypothetical protein
MPARHQAAQIQECPRQSLTGIGAIELLRLGGKQAEVIRLELRELAHQHGEEPYLFIFGVGEHMQQRGDGRTSGAREKVEPRSPRSRCHAPEAPVGSS